MGADVIVQAAFDSTLVRSGVDQLKSTVKGAEAEISGSFARMFAGGAVLALGDRLLSLGDRLSDLSDRFGVSTTILQQWGNAAEQNGSSTEGLAAAFNKLEIARSKALGGNDGLIQSFQNLNVSVEDLKNLSPDEIMQKIGASSLNAADTVKLLGRGALELRPLLQGVADGSIQLGKAISEGSVRALGDAHDNIEEVKQDLTIFAGETLGFALRSWKTFWTELVGVSFAGKELVVGYLDAVNKALHFDFSGAKKAADAAVSNAGAQIKTANDSVDEIWNPASTSSGGFVGRAGGDAGATDDFGNPTGKSGGAAGAISSAISLQERLNKLQEDAAARQRDSYQELNALVEKRDAILTNSAKTNVDELGTLKTNISLLETDKAIAEQRAKIEKDEQSDARETARIRESAAAENERFQAAFTKAVNDGIKAGKEQAQAAADARDEMEKQVVQVARQNQLLQLTADGHKDIAAELQKEWEIDDRIAQAQKDGNVDLVKQLQIQKDLVKELNERAKKEKEIADTRTDYQKRLDPRDPSYSAYAADVHLGMQRLANNLGTYSSEETAHGGEADFISALQLRFGKNFGTSGPGGGPSAYEQNLIRTYQNDPNARAQLFAEYDAANKRNAPQDAGPAGPVFANQIPDFGMQIPAGGNFFSPELDQLRRLAAVGAINRDSTGGQVSELLGGKKATDLLGNAVIILGNIHDKIEPPIG